MIDCDSVACTAGDLFNSATVFGGDALGRGDLGIYVGAKADLVFVGLDSVRMSPVRDPVRSLVYGASEEDVKRVIVDGKTVVLDGLVLGMDEQVISEELQRIGDHFIDAIPSRNPEGKTADEISPMSFKSL